MLKMPSLHRSPTRQKSRALPSATGSHQHYSDVNPFELADAHRDAGVLVFQHFSRLGDSWVNWSSTILNRGKLFSAGGVGVELMDFHYGLIQDSGRLWMLAFFFPEGWQSGNFKWFWPHGPMVQRQWGPGIEWLESIEQETYQAALRHSKLSCKQACLPMGPNIVGDVVTLENHN